jgi:hypothetical protein
MANVTNEIHLGKVQDGDPSTPQSPKFSASGDWLVQCLEMARLTASTNGAIETLHFKTLSDSVLNLFDIIEVSYLLAEVGCIFILILLLHAEKQQKYR